jgi:hypothetical protein
MRLGDILAAVRGSSTEDWNVVSGFGTIYRDRLVIVTSTQHGQRLEHEGHFYSAAYLPDVSITMAWGMADNKDFQEPWANGFPDKNASSAFVDIFYNNALVFRDTYVSVDGGRADLPIPNTREDLTVSVDDYQLAKIVHEMTHAKTPFEDYFVRAGLKRDR